VILLLIPILILQFPFAKNRINSAKENLTSFYSNKNIMDSVHINGVAMRLNTWVVMLNTIKGNPVFGIGLGGFKSEIQKYVNEKAVHPIMGDLPHSHNQYIEISINSGLPGLFFNLCVLIIPGFIFYKSMQTGSPKVQSFAATGLVVILAYLIYGIGDLTLTRKIPIIFFGLTISILLSIMYQQEKSDISNPKNLSS